MNKYEILIFLTTIQYIIDIQMYPCEKLKGKILLYLHHLIDIYIYFGGFLFNPFIHLITVIVTLIHWILNDNKCAFTQLTNTICYPEYSGYKGFNDFSRMSGLQDKYPNISYYYLGGVILYDLNQIWPILK